MMSDPNAPYGYMGNNSPYPMQPQPNMMQNSSSYMGGYPSQQSGMGGYPSTQSGPNPLQNNNFPRYANGGRVFDTARRIRDAGQRGDRILAHINPREAMELQQQHGMDINPHTGLPQFGLYDSLMSGVNSAYDYGRNGLSNLGNYAQGFAKDLWSNYGHPLANQGLGYLDTAIQGALPLAGAGIGNGMAGPYGGLAGGAIGGLASERYGNSGGLQGNLMPKLTNYFGGPSANAPQNPTVNGMLQSGMGRLGGDIQSGLAGMDQNIQSRLPSMAANMGGQFGGNFGRDLGQRQGEQMANSYGGSGGLSGMIMPYVDRARNALPKLGFANGGRVGNFTKGSEYIRSLGQRGDDILAHISPEEAQELSERHGGDINPHTGLPQFGLGDWLMAGVGALAAPFTGGMSLALAAPALFNGVGEKATNPQPPSIAQQMSNNPIPEGPNYFPRPLPNYRSRHLKPKREHFDFSGPEYNFFEEDEDLSPEQRRRMAAEEKVAADDRMAEWKRQDDDYLRRYQVMSMFGGTARAKQRLGPRPRQPFASGGYLDGDTNGKADVIRADLSDGEYVLDAPFLSFLGGGNSNAGAKTMDELREMAGVAEKFKPQRTKKVIKKMVDVIKERRK